MPFAPRYYILRRFPPLVNSQAWQAQLATGSWVQQGKVVDPCSGLQIHWQISRMGFRSPSRKGPLISGRAMLILSEQVPWPLLVLLVDMEQSNFMPLAAASSTPLSFEIPSCFLCISFCLCVACSSSGCHPYRDVFRPGILDTALYSLCLAPSLMGFPDKNVC